MNKNEQMWAGKLGNEYTHRNYDEALIDERDDFWERMLNKYSCERTLEVGCDGGMNIESICRYTLAYGIDINEYSLMKASRVGWLIWGKANDIPFKDNYFDLVFTAGLLIHIPPDDIDKVIDEMIRCSNKYVLCIEYYAPKERERPFLGQMGITWERPYDTLLQNNGLKIIEAGYLTPQQGFNNCGYWMCTKC